MRLYSYAVSEPSTYQRHNFAASEPQLHALCHPVYITLLNLSHQPDAQPSLQEVPSQSRTFEIYFEDAHGVRLNSKQQNTSSHQHCQPRPLW